MRTKIITGGLNVRFLPLSKDNKPLIAYKDHPLLKDGLEEGEWVSDATEQGYGVGTLLDNSGLVVIDTDSSISFGRRSKQVFGWANFQTLCNELGLNGIPKTFTVQTKTPGHYHFYFTQHPDYPLTRTSIHSQIPQVDVKVTGYVVSWHTEGYSVVRDTGIHQLPELLARRLYRSRADDCVGGVVEGDRAVTDDYADYILRELAHTTYGERNARLYRTAKTFQSAGLTTPLDRSRLMQAAVTAGLRETEAERTVESAWS